MRNLMLITLILFPVLMHSCNIGQAKTDIPSSIISEKEPNPDSLETIEYYANNSKVTKPSHVIGTVSKGKLNHGKLFPFYGDNFSYFDSRSYLNHRAFTSDAVLSTILASYQDMKSIADKRHFYLMELSNKEGGQIYPHRTHQNGLSADFMMPMLKDNAPYIGLDTLGIDHYWLKFNNKGEYSEDKSVKVDFELIAKHILNLEKNARKNGLKISKVIIKIEFKDELFSSAAGQRLKNSGIYVVQNLSKLINDIHDDHYHIDFKKV